MKNFLTSFIFSLCFLSVSAQQDRFIYLQTENKQPFFVKLNNKILNSYPLGYLIIPKLDDGLYSLVIGFPETDYEQEFNCAINKRDVGFVIKNVGEKQWQLLNVQTNNIIVPGGTITKPVIVYEKETDPFSTMLANAVHDSTILRKDIAKAIIPEKPDELIVKDTSQVIVSNNDVTVAKTSSDSAGKEVVKEVQPEKTEVVQKNTSDTLNTAVAIRPNNVASDSTKNVVKEIVSEIPKDTAVTVDPTVVISNTDNTLKADSPGSNNTVKEIAEKKPGEIVQGDSSLVTIPNDVALTKSQKRKARRNNNALQDSTVIQKETVKVIPETVNQNKDSAQGATSNSDLAVLKSTIKRRTKKTSRDGMELMYVDTYGDTKDTIRILIPSEKKEKKDMEINTEPVVITPAQQENKTKEDDSKTNSNKLSEEEKKVIQEAKEPVVKSAMINSDCKNFATGEDFLKTRKKMVMLINYLTWKKINQVLCLKAYKLCYALLRAII